MELQRSHFRNCNFYLIYIYKIYCRIPKEDFDKEGKLSEKNLHKYITDQMANDLFNEYMTRCKDLL